MLGSLVDADDTVQETLLAAWRGLDRFEERSTVRTWLYRIATNRCLNAIRDGKRRPPVEPTPPFEPPPPSARAEVTWLQPYPDRWLAQAPDDPASGYLARENVELAFVVALQRLPPRQTAALLLCDVMGFSMDEAAEMIGATKTAVKGALQRARGVVDRHSATDDGSDEDRAVARRFADAFAWDDIDGVVRLLTDDAWLAMPPASHEYHGPGEIAAFLQAGARWRGQRRMILVPTGANRQPAFCCYLPGLAGESPEPVGLIVLTTRQGRVQAITRFLDGALPRLFE